MNSVFYVHVKPEIYTLCKERISKLGPYIEGNNQGFFVYTDKNAQDIFSHLSAGIQNPSMLVIHADITTGQYYGHAPKALWDWINEIRPKWKNQNKSKNT